MFRHEQFEWDRDKDRRNQRKHRVSFADAAQVLSDAYGDVFHLTQPDDRHDELEERWITIGSHPYNRSLVFYIVWTYRPSDPGLVTRIISARPASPFERRQYEKDTFQF